VSLYSTNLGNISADKQEVDDLGDEEVFERLGWMVPFLLIGK
jgi:hypothetical protein